MYIEKFASIKRASARMLLRQVLYKLAAPQGYGSTMVPYNTLQGLTNQYPGLQDYITKNKKVSPEGVSFNFLNQEKNKIGFQLPGGGNINLTKKPDPFSGNMPDVSITPKMQANLDAAKVRQAAKVTQPAVPTAPVK